MGFLCGRSTDLGQQLIVLRRLWDASGSGNEDGLYAGYGIVPSVFQQGGHQYFDKSRTLGKFVCPNYSLSPFFGIPFLPMCRIYTFVPLYSGLCHDILPLNTDCITTWVFRLKFGVMFQLKKSNFKFQ